MAFVKRRRMLHYIGSHMYRELNIQFLNSHFRHFVSLVFNLQEEVYHRTKQSCRLAALGRGACRCVPMASVFPCSLNLPRYTTPELLIAA